MGIWLKFLAISMAIGSVASAQPALETETVLQAAEQLRPGEFFWAPDVAPEGPVLLVVNRATQRLLLYRNGVPIAISTVSTGRPGYRTPTGIFTILQKEIEHYSNTYDNAAMPFMQRLTWSGVALHAGGLPGYPASHGCVRLPPKFAELLYGVTRLGMTVVITDRDALPSVAPRPERLLDSSPAESTVSDASFWQPKEAPAGPVSIVISAADRRVVVLRNGRIIGAAPIAIEGTVTGTSANVLHAVNDAGRHWLQIPLPGQIAGPAPLQSGQFKVAETFRRHALEVLQPGATVIITADPFRDTPLTGVTVLEASVDTYER